MDLPVMPPLKPMLAKAVTWEWLEASGLLNVVEYSPKWDGMELRPQSQ